MTAVHGRVVATSRADPRVRVVGVVISEQSTVIVTGHFAPGLFELRADRGVAIELLGCLGETVQASVTLEYDASVNAVGGEIHGWRPMPTAHDEDRGGSATQRSSRPSACNDLPRRSTNGV